MTARETLSAIRRLGGTACSDGSSITIHGIDPSPEILQAVAENRDDILRELRELKVRRSITNVYRNLECDGVLVPPQRPCKRKRCLKAADERAYRLGAAYVETGAECDLDAFFAALDALEAAWRA